VQASVPRDALSRKMAPRDSGVTGPSGVATPACATVTKSRLKLGGRRSLVGVAVG
jgi:hypothetical protein